MGLTEHKLIAPCPDCGVRVATTATVYLHLDDCPQVDEAVLRERLRGAVEAATAGRRWTEPYCKPDAPLAEQITALVNACSYWHAVAEGGQ